MGWYGDFGRYVMQSAVTDFCDVPMDAIEKPTPDAAAFSSMRARAYVVERVKSLGWTPDLFAAYEDRLLHGRMSYDEEQSKVERISKKYQWIALYEFLGLLSDHYTLKPDWHGNPVRFNGAWQLNVGDFDPSAPPPKADDADAIIGQDALSKPALADAYADPFRSDAMAKGRAAWLTTAPDDFRPLLTLRPALGSHSVAEWITVACYRKWVEPTLQRPARKTEGTLEMFFFSRSWVVASAQAKPFANALRPLVFVGHGATIPTLGDGWLGEYPIYLRAR